MRLQVPLAAMKEFLERTNIGQKREDRFNQTALIPRAFLTQLQVLQHPVLRAKTEIAQGNRLCFVLFDQRQKDIVTGIGRRPLPIHHTPVLIDDPAHFDAHDPAPIALAFLPDLLLRAPFVDRVNQFDAVAVHHRCRS